MTLMSSFANAARWMEHHGEEIFTLSKKLFIKGNVSNVTNVNTKQQRKVVFENI